MLCLLLILRKRTIYNGNRIDPSTDRKKLHSSSDDKLAVLPLLFHNFFLDKRKVGSWPIIRQMS